MPPRHRFAFLPLACAIAQGWAVQELRAQILPVQGSVTAGQATLQSPALGQLTVRQTSPRAVIDWRSFSVGSGAQLNFEQPNAQSAVLNRVTGDMRSEIAGRIVANGQFFLVNPNGIQVTPTGTVQAAGIVLSTLDVRNDDFMSGAALTFEGQRAGGSAAVVNQGKVLGAKGGFAALIGGRIANDGRIEVPLGRIALGAGERATLDLNGNGLLQIALPSGTDDGGRPLIDVAGRLVADGGRIEISAATARNALRHAVNLPGELQARSVAGRSGEIFLAAGDGGTVSIDGRLDAGGVGRADVGGSITVTGAGIALRGAKIEASGDAGGGRVRIGGERAGGAALPRAQSLDVDAASRITADARVDGTGGDVVLWSDARTAFSGTISARGAGFSRGGEAEVSGRALLLYEGTTDLRSTRGDAGTLLLDPYDVTISTGANTGAGFTAAANNTVINTTTLANALASANVTVSTGSGGAQTGNITVSNAVTWGGGTRLTLQAAGSINSNAALTASAGGGVTMNAGSNIIIADGANITTGGGAMNIALNATGTTSVGNTTLATNGGSFVATGTATSSNIGVRLNGSTVNVGAGTGTITGTSPSGYGISLDNAVQLAASGGGSIGLAGALTTSTVAVSASALHINGALTTTGTINGTGTASGNAHGLVLRSGATINSTGALALQGSTGSASRNGAMLLGSNALTVNAGTLSITGTATGTAIGLLNAGSQNYTNLGAGSLSLTGNGTSNSGMQWNTVTAALTGSTSFTGNATVATGFYWNGANSVTLASGSATFSGSSTTAGGSRGIWFNNTGSVLNNLGSGNLTLNGSTASSNASNYALGFSTNVGVTTSGTVALNGASSTGAAGILLVTANTLQAASGTLTVAGNSANGIGVRVFSGNNSLIASGGASLVLTGSSTGHNGVVLENGVSISASGSVSLAGSTAATVGSTTAPNRFGLLFSSGTSVSVGSGSVTIAGSASQNAAGIYTSGNLALTQSGTSSLALLGSSATGFSVRLGGGTLTSTGTVSIASTSSRLVLEANEIISVAAGSLALTGSNTGSAVAGISVKGAITLNNTAGGSLRLAGTSTGYLGIEVQGSGSLTANGDVLIEGTSTATTGLSFGGAYVQNSGSLTAVGMSANANGFSLTSSTPLTNAGTGALLITSNGGMQFGGAVTSNAGYVRLQAGGTVTQSATFVANRLLLTGAAGNYLLTQAGNQIGTIAGTTGSVDLYSANGLTVGTVQGSTGLVASGQPILRSGAALTLASGASVQGASPVLAAAGGFQNLSGGTALVANSGRWLVYAASPASSSFGGLDSGHEALWNATYASMPPASVAVSGHRYLFASQPTLVFSPVGASKVYGNDGAAALQPSFAVSGYAPGVAGTYLGDSAASAWTGAPVLSSPGTATTAGVAGGPYPITLAQGTVAGANGYATSFTTGGANLTVTARPITVSADALSRVYGDATPALTAQVTTGSLVNGDTLSGALATATNAASNVGSYAITQGSLVASSNYALSYLPANLNVTARPITVSADALSRVYGDANPALTVQVTTGSLVNGDTLTGALATATNAASNVGSYAITQGSLVASSNYALSYLPANLNVTARPITVSADAQSRVYGDANPALTAQVTSGSLVNGDTLSGALATATNAASNVGSYAITQGSLVASSNYALSYLPANLNVTARPITVSADAQSRVYGDANPALTAQVTSGSLVNGDTLSGALATATNAASNVGSYAITQGSLAASSNYALSYLPANLNVTARPITVSADALSRVYGDANPALTAQVTTGSLVNGDTLSGALATSANLTSNVGSYAITQGSLVTASNYALSFVPSALDVTPRPVTVTADAMVRSFGQPNPALSVHVSRGGLVNGDVISGAASTAAFEASPVGRYSIEQGSLSAGPNYALSYEAGLLTVLPALAMPHLPYPLMAVGDMESKPCGVPVEQNLGQGFGRSCLPIGGWLYTPTPL